MYKRIAAPIMKTVQVKNYFLTKDIIDLILFADEDAAAARPLKDFAPSLRGRSDYETCRNVWRFVKKSISYKPDDDGHEKVQAPNRLIYSGVGDCKSFSILEGALLRELGISYKYRFAGYEKGEVTHVYIIAKVDGNEVVMDAVYDRFDEEVPYLFKKDVKPRTASVGGFTLHVPAPTSNNWGYYLVGGILLYLILK